MVRAKFQCTRIEQGAYGLEGHNHSAITMTAVSGNENKSWSKWTPSGQLTMTVNNPEAVKQFEIGKHYFLDFSEAPAKEADEKP
jgi:hypothetical protein